MDGGGGRGRNDPHLERPDALPELGHRDLRTRPSALRLADTAVHYFEARGHGRPYAEAAH